MTAAPPDLMHPAFFKVDRAPVAQAEDLSMTCEPDLAAARARRIVHVPRRFVAEEWGGTETVVLEIAKQQQCADLEPVIITSMALAKRHDEIISGVPVHRYGYCYPFLGLSREEKAAMDKKGGNLLSLPLLVAMLREPDVRLFHAHTLKRLGGTVRTAARLRGKPYVASVHGGVFDVPTAESETMLKPIEGKWEWGRPFGALLGSRRVLEDADMVIFVSESEAATAHERLGHDRIAHLPNGVDCARFAQGDGAAFRGQHGIPQDAFVALNISRIDAQKNQLLLVASFRELAARRADAHLVLMGPVTQPDYAARLRNCISQSGLDGRVHVLPGLKNNDPALVDAYHACDVFVLPSMHEPFGIVVLEAWSAGRPVIASNVGGLRTLVRDYETGLQFDPSAPTATDELTEKLLLLADDADLRSRLARRGQSDAKIRYDWSRIAARQEEIYQLAERHHVKRRERRAS